jgi:hypothetical protein
MDELGIGVLSHNPLCKMQQQQCSSVLEWLDTSFCCQPDCSSRA